MILRVAFRNLHRNLSSKIRSPVVWQNWNVPKYYSKDFKTQELSFPVLGGNIAAKAWGSESGYPVLALHGWLDNAGTFDRLIPLLSDKYYYVAIDAPGHGRSYHKAPAAMYCDTDTVLDLKRLVDYLGWDKFHIMGHSMGGAFAQMFASIFPDRIEKLISFDCAKHVSVDLELVPDVMIKSMLEMLEMEEKLKRSPPVYDTLELAAERYRKGTNFEVEIEGARILMKRGTRPSDCGKGVIFSRDLRCRTMEYLSLRSHNLMANFMKRLKCEFLLIMAKNTSPHYISDTPDTIERFIEIYKQNSKNFVLEYVEGNHFVHLNNPERISPIVNRFL